MASPQSESIRQMLLEQKEAAKKGPTLSIEEQRKQLDALGRFVPLDPDVTVEKTRIADVPGEWIATPNVRDRSEEHTSELQSRENLVCRLLLEKKNTDNFLASDVT